MNPMIAIAGALEAASNASCSADRFLLAQEVRARA